MIVLKRDPFRVFRRIQPNWDHDVHIHTNWSEDNLNGPSFEDYIPLAQKYKTHIGFADHFEMQYYRKYGGGPRNPEDPPWKLNPNSLEKYLEEIDGLKEHYSFVSSGLELDYYPEKKEELREFVDDYHTQFDLFYGSVHETEKYQPITILEFFNSQVQKMGSFQAVLNKYWDLMFEMVDDQIFDAVAHPDVIYRFLEREKVANTNPEYLHDLRVVELGKRCIETYPLMEVNLSGFFKSWGQSFPKEEFVYNLLAEGTKFIVGSDSHSPQDFEKSILKTRYYNQILKTRLN